MKHNDKLFNNFPLHNNKREILLHLQLFCEFNKNILLIDSFMIFFNCCNYLENKKYNRVRTYESSKTL